MKVTLTVTVLEGTILWIPARGKRQGYWRMLQSKKGKPVGIPWRLVSR